MCSFRFTLALSAAFLCLGAGNLGAETEYALRPSDRIRIAVFQEPDLITETRIAKSGHITFPLLGTVHLAGKTISEAVAEITDRLNRDYIINPHVTLTVLEYASERIMVLGQVQKPGAISIPEEGNLDLLGAIAMAGGFTDLADVSDITVRRQSGSKTDVRRVSGADAAKLFRVQASDVISVGERLKERVTIMGEVQRPGVVEIPAGDKIDLLEAIALAGGYTETAKASRITVRRRVEGQDKLYMIDGERLAGDAEARPFYMKPNDIVTVGESFF